MKYAWIEGQREHYGLDELCRVLDVSVSGYRAWQRGGKPGRKRLTDAQMSVLIQAVHLEFKGSYGSPRMTADIVTDALTMAWFRRKPAAGLLHHLDRGSQYASQAFQGKLKGYGMDCSMSRKGDCWECEAYPSRYNAPTESWFGSFKNERVYGECFETWDEARRVAFEYIEVFYNRRRRHSTLGYKSPQRFLGDWLNGQPPEKLVA